MPLRDKYRKDRTAIPGRLDSDPPRAGIQSLQYRILQGLGCIGTDRRMEVRRKV